MSIKEQLDNNGWVLCKNIFTKSEIDEFRKSALESKSWNGDLLSHKTLRKMMLNKKIVDIAKQSIDSNELLYFGDSTISINTQGIGQHKDSVDRKHPKGKDWEKGYSLIRIGIYLQDHKVNAGGLSLRHKSHVTSSLNHGKLINVPNEVGDVVVWKLTTTHSANANSFRFAPKIPAHAYLIRFLPNFLFRNVPVPRIAIFMTFGKDDYHFHKYIEYLKTREYMVKIWKNTSFSKEGIDEAKKMDVTVHQIDGLDSIDESKLNKKFKQIYFD
jgi:hypothetical protein